jgi:flavin-dependent dehydrogenase
VTRVDVAVIGGGPAGLAAGIELARRGLSVHLFEKRPEIPDKACGEGILPEGAEWLASRGIPQLIDPAWSSEFVGIRYVEDGKLCAEARFRRGHGLGVRRIALIAAMEKAATAAGVHLHHGVPAKLIEQRPDAVRIEAGETLETSLVVAADGLNSGWRGSLDLEPGLPAIRRFGQRRHFRGVDPGEFVEVHWSDGVEAYLTPVGHLNCGIAFLWEATDSRATYDDLLAKFPAIKQRFSGIETTSEVRGAGPLARTVKRCVSHRVVLLGDSAGYADAITGEGMSIAFASASSLGEVAQRAVQGDLGALQQYANAHAKLFRRYALFANSLVWLSRRPRLRRTVFAALRRAPSLFENALSLVG